MRNKLRSHKGYTLIELLIVVTIVGILSLSAVPLMADHVQKAKRVEAESIARVLMTQARAAYAETGKPPTNLTDPVESGGAGVPTKFLKGSHFVFDAAILTPSTTGTPEGGAGSFIAKELDEKTGLEKPDGVVSVTAFAWRTAIAVSGWYRVGSGGSSASLDFYLGTTDPSTSTTSTSTTTSTSFSSLDP